MPTKPIRKVKKEKTKLKNIKAWILIHSELRQPECEEYFIGGGCCCREEARSIAVYEHKRDAEANAKFYSAYEVVPCEIHLITKPKKK